MKKIKNICGIALFSVIAFSLYAKDSESAELAIENDESIVGYYTFDDDYEENFTEVIDHSASKLNVSTASMDGSILDEGYDDMGLVFNGRDELIILDNSMLSGKGFTFSAWVNPSQWRPWMRVLDIGNQVDDLWIGMDGISGKLRMDIGGLKMRGNWITVTAPLPPTEEWTHIAATIDGKVAKLYINGKLKQRIPCPITPEMLVKNVQGIFIGASNWAPDPLFNGVMDNIVIAKRALSAKEITALFKGRK